MRYLVIALISFGLLSTSAEARHRYVRTYAADPNCNVIMPCIGVAPSSRGERVVRAMGGFGSAQQRYTPSAIISHPAGCPSRAFCGCGASVRVFGHSVRNLWLAANWYRFPKTLPAAGTVAVRRHHVMVLEAHLGGNIWQVYDANSGGHATRVHARSIIGYTIVNPHS